MISVVLTTINIPPNLNSILQQIGQDDNIIIVTDRKTPEFSIDDKRVIIVDIKKQIEICKNPIGVPFDCIQRRNFGYIYAIKYLNPDSIITIDDDNFVNNGWFAEHLKNIGEGSHTVALNKTNIINSILSFSCKMHHDCGNVVHRGVSFVQAHDFIESVTTEKKIKVGVNAGLWTGDPDINAYDRVLHPDIKSSIRAETSLVLNNSWKYPFNSQNTIIDNFLFPTIFLIPMFKTFYGQKIGRYDDIWQSYISEKIMSHYDLYVRFGTPIVYQKRNNHNIKTDINEEFVGLMFNETFLESLENIRLFCNSPLDNMYEISEAFLLDKNIVLNYIGEKILWWLTEIK